MLEELIERYSQYSDGELMTVYLNKKGYTIEAQKALETVVERKGGIQSLKERYDKIVEKEDEKLKIHEEVIKLYEEGLTQNDIKSRLDSEILSIDEIKEITEETYNSFELKKKDEKIKSSTIIGSIIGGIIGGTTGGILWGLQMIYSGRVFYIFAIGLFFISYGFIKFFTKQSKNNMIVFIAIMLSVIFAFFLGFYIYNIFGYRYFRTRYFKD